MKPNRVMKCCRCRKRCRNTQGWNVQYRAGRIAGYLCPGCQTVEEDLEAQVNAAMCDYRPAIDLRGLETGELDPATIATLQRIAAGAEPVEVVVVEDVDPRRDSRGG